MTIAILAAVLIGLALLVLVVAVGLGNREPTGVARSLAMIEGHTLTAGQPRADAPAFERLVEPLLTRSRGLARALSPGGADERLVRLLDNAGNPKPWTPDRILGVKGAALLLGAALGLLVGGLGLKGLLFAVVLAVGLFFLPDLLLINTGIKRKDEARKGMAEALDMLTVCVEAGQGFDSALHQVARTIDGPIASEFARALAEIQIGRSRGEAFSGMGQRIDTPEVRSFVTALVQADRLGLPIGQVLREQTATMRLARRQRAEEKAHKVAVKILIPLMLCILPAMFVVILGPGIIRLMGMFQQF